MASSRQDGDLVVTGELSAASIKIPNSSVGDTQFKSSDPLTVEKQENLIIVGGDGGLGVAGSFAAKHVHVLTVPAACNIRTIRASLAGACTTGTAGFDVNKNGTSVMASHITFTSADSAGAIKTSPGDVTLSTSTLAADDVLTIQFTADSGSPDGTGPWVQIELDMVAP